MPNKIWVGTSTPGDWSVDANWSPATKPATGDDVYFKDSSQDVTAGWDQSAILLASLNIDQSYTGKIGDATNYLIIGATKVRIGYHDGPGTMNGSGRLKIDLRDDLSSVSTIVVENSGTSYDTGKPAIRILTNNVSSTLEVKKGSVGLAYEVGETSTINKVTSDYISQISGDADVVIGSGLSITTINQNGGDILLKCAATTVNANAGGTLQTEGTGAITNLNAKGGKTIPNSTGTITNLTISENGDVDMTKSNQARTVTTPKIDKNGRFKYNPSIVTLTNKIASNNQVVLTAS